MIGIRISVNLKKQKNQEKITFHIQINVDSFSGDSTESNDVLDANDVVVLDGTWSGTCDRDRKQTKKEVKMRVLQRLGVQGWCRVSTVKVQRDIEIKT